MKAERHLSGAVEAALIRNGVTEPFLSGRVWEGVVKAERHLSGAVEAALKGVAGFEALLEEADEFGVADQAPGSGVDKARRDFAGEALDVEVGPQAFQQVGDKVQVSVQAECDEIRRARGELALYGRAAHDLELVELDRVQRQLINNRCVGQHVLCRFSGKAEDEMCSLSESARGSHLHGPDSVSECVPPVDAP